MIYVTMFLYSAFVVILLKLLWNKKFSLYVFLILQLFVGFIAYEAIYPSENFYRNEFFKNTKINLSKECDFLYKEVSFPDQQGDYYSIAIVELNTNEYQSLFNSIKSWEKQDSTIFIIDNVFLNNQNVINGKTILSRFSKSNNGIDRFSVGFFENKKSIIFCYLNP